MLSTLLALTLAGSPVVSSVASPEGPIFTNPATMSSVILRLPLTVSTADECSGASIPGVTFSRSSSATCTKSDGTVVTLSANQPRVTAAGLLIEGGATNLALRSDALSTSPWAVDASVVVTADQGTAPDGTASADLVDNTAATNLSGNYQSITVTSSAGPFTYSAYAAKQSGTGVAGVVAICGGSVSVSACTCDREDGTACTATTSGSQCRVYSTHSTTPRRIALHVTCASAVTSVLVSNVAGQPGTSTGRSLFWGAQLETGSIATSYIPTAGTSAARTADLATVTTPARLSRTEGCSRACFAPLWTGNSPAGGWILSGNTGGTARFAYFNPTSDTVKAFDGAHGPTATAGFTAGASSCFITDWSAATGNITITNLSNASTETVTGFTTLGALDATTGIGSSSSGSLPVNGSIKDIRFGARAGACQ